MAPTKYAVHKSFGRSVTCAVTEIPRLGSVTIDHILPEGHSRGWGTEAAQLTLHTPVQLPPLRLDIRVGARMVYSAHVNYLPSPVLRGSAILRTILAFLFDNSKQLNISTIEIGDYDTDAEDVSAILLIPRPRRMHTLAATATPRLTATLAEDMHVADHATTSSSHTSTGTCSVPRLGLDLIWCSHQRREEEDDNVVTRDSAPLLHALSQTNVVAPPLLAPLMTALTRTLGARLLQSMTLNVVVRETPLFPLGYGPASSETHLPIPIFNGAFLDRQEAVNPRLASLARSLTAISWAAQNRIHRRGRAEQDEANAEQWASCENSVGSHIAELTGHTLQEAHSRGDNRFLAILHALLRKDQEMYGPDSIKPKLRMNPSTESVKAAFTSLVAGAPEAPHTTIFQVQEHQNADAALIPFPHPTSTSDHPGEHAAVHAINELRFDDSEDDIWTSPRPVTVSNLPNPAQMADLDAICARLMARAGPKASVEPPESEFEDMDHVAVFEEHELVADVDNVNESPLSGQWEQEFVLLPEDEGERSSVATAHQSTFWFSDGSLADMDGTYDKFGDVILSDLEACPRSHGSTQDCPPSPCLMSMDDANDDEMQYMSE